MRNAYRAFLEEDENSIDHDNSFRSNQTHEYKYNNESTDRDSFESNQNKKSANNK